MFPLHQIQEILFFLLYLSGQKAAINNNAQQQPLILQTVYTDKLGGTTNSFSLNEYGASFNFDSSRILNSTHDPIKIGSPFCNLFVDEPYQTNQSTK